MNEKRTGIDPQGSNQKRKKYLKWIGVGVCGIAILTLTLYLTQAKETATEPSDPIKLRDTELVEPKKDKKPEKRQSSSKKKESVEEVYKNFGISPSSSMSSSENRNATLSSNDLRTIAQVYNERRDLSKSSNTQTQNNQPNIPSLPVITPTKPNPTEPKPTPVPEPIIPEPVISSPTIHLSQEHVVVGQGSLFSPYEYFSVDNGGDTNTTIQVTGIDTSIIGQQYCTITATNSRGTTEQILSVYVNALPVIQVSTETIDVPLRSNPNLLVYVTATDVEDGDITQKVTVDTDLDSTKEGDYWVTFSVTDSHGFSTSKTVAAKVTNEAPVIEAHDIEVEIDQPFNPLDYVKAMDREDGEITLTEENILKNDVDTTTEGTYEVTIGNVKDSDGKETEKTFKVTVKNELPVITVPTTVLKIGEAFNVETFKQSVKVTDREDDKKGIPVTLTFDEEALKLVTTESVNTFTISIEATDSHGGKNKVEAKIIVEAAEEPKPELETEDTPSETVKEALLLDFKDMLVHSTIIEPSVTKENATPVDLSEIENRTTEQHSKDKWTKQEQELVK